MNLITIYLSLLLYLFGSSEAPKSGITEIDVCLSQEEMQLYLLINEYRKQKKLPPVALSQALTKVAKAHAVDLVNHYDIADRDKCNPHSWSDQGPWRGCCYTNDHKDPQCMWEKPKEIAGYPGPAYEILFWHSSKAEPVRSLEGWKKSPPHNEVIINSDIWKKVTWKALGIAIYENYAIAWFGETEDEEKPDVCGL